MTTKTKSEKSPKSAKQKLAEGAEKIRKLAQENKSKTSKKGPKSTKPAKDAGELEVLPKIEESKAEIGDILSRCVEINKANTSVSVSKETTPGEFLRIFDYFRHSAEFAPFLLGDVLNAAPSVFGEKYAAALASTGRSIHTLKAYASAAKHIPPALRNVHEGVNYTHLRELVKVPELEDKKAIVKEAVAAAEAGKPLTVKQIRVKADKFKPRKPRKKKEAKAPHVMNESEQREYNEVRDKAEELATLIKGMAFLADLTEDQRKPVRDPLAKIAEFAKQL